jgi:hypothetical protein
VFFLLKMNEEEKSNKANGGEGKTKSQRGLYAQFEPLAKPSIERLREMLQSRNEAIALGAVKIVLNKVLPDKKAVELKGEDGAPIIIKVIKDDTFNLDGNTTTDTELPEAGVNISITE